MQNNASVKPENFKKTKFMTVQLKQAIFLGVLETGQPAVLPQENSLCWPLEVHFIGEIRYSQR